MAIGRRQFLGAAGAWAVLHGCSLGPVVALPRDSPMRQGRHAVGRARLGITPGTARPPMPAHVQLAESRFNTERCADGVVRVSRPAAIDAKIWYPARRESSDFGRPIEHMLRSGERYPLILYAHAKRKQITCTELVPDGLDSDLADYSLDHRRVDAMLSHIASWGFVVVAPDLGWLLSQVEVGSVEDVDDPRKPHAFSRARILIALHDALLAQPGDWFSRGVNADMIGLFGHSNGATACLGASTRIANTRILGLLAPAVENLAVARNNHAALVIGGTNDTNQGANPDAVYALLTGEKFLVTIGGANHLGFTALCSDDNRVCMDEDPVGDIPRSVQKATAAAYLTAGARAFLYGDVSMRDYLHGARPTGAEPLLPSLVVASPTRDR